MPFNLFRKKKPEQEAPEASTQQPEPQPAPSPQETPKEATPQTADERVNALVQALQPEEKPVIEAPVETAPAPTPESEPVSAPAEEKPQETPAPAAEQPKEQPAEQTAEEKAVAAPEPPSKTYLKAMPLKELSDVENVENEVRNGNIVILRVTPLAGKSIEDVKTAVNQLFQFAESVGGDIARLGEERVVICPKNIRIWREKTPAPVAGAQPLPTAA